ncbi:MAG: NAD(+) diphosphatase [Parvularculaceae bacterium]
MKISDNPNLFAGNALNRASDERCNAGWIAEKLDDPDSVMIPLWRGDPLVADDAAAWLTTAARSEFASSAETVFLGLDGARAHFAIDASAAADADAAPFADIGAYLPLRKAADILAQKDVAIIGHARWLLDWHRRHRHCAVCGEMTIVADGGAKRVCVICKAEHFPRSDPVAIVVATHGDACLLGRGPHFPPGALSALAGFVEAAETPEECAARELREEAGVRLTDIRYQFSQPWPFPSSLMMGFLADAADRDLNLDMREIVEARWLERPEIISLLNGDKHEDFFLPPRFTIARRLIECWARG